MTKKKVVLTVIALILIALIAFCLIYIRPRTLDSLLDGREITGLTAAHALSYKFSLDDAWETYLLDEENCNAQVLSDLTEIVGSCKYRTKLISLTHPHSSSDSTMENGGNRDNVTLRFALSDNSFLSISYTGSKVLFSFDDQDGMIITKPTDKEVNTKLGEYISQFGELEQ